MPTAQDGLPITQFGDIKFPGETHTVDGTGRHHVHEYPHTPGGLVEKLGRSLYEITIRGNFQATFTAFPDLYPNGLATMRGYFENQTTLQLVHPTVGTFPAFITKWRQVKEARMLSGEKVDITFLEDQSQQFQLADLVTSADDTAIGPSADRLAAELQQVMDELAISPNDMSLFDSIQQLSQDIGAIGDTLNLYGNVYGAKLQALAGTCASLEATFSLQDARAWPVVDALLDVWQAAQLSLQDLQLKRATMNQYVVPKQETMIDVAIGIYGDASRASDLLSLNPLVADAMRVPANTIILYYP
jgi:prophage DNA circulation protein